jgi:hypothetical protein
MAVEQKPLMPKATAVWLVDNTSLSFEQIAEFCGLHPLEVKGIADEDVAKGIKGQDPVTSGQLTREAIEEAEKNPKIRLKMAAAKHKMPNVKLKKAPRYTPVSKRQDKPDAVYWIIRNHPEFADADIIKLIGTTKATIQKIRERSHWGFARSLNWTWPSAAPAPSMRAPSSGLPRRARPSSRSEKPRRRNLPPKPRRKRPKTLPKAEFYFST